MSTAASEPTVKDFSPEDLTRLAAIQGGVCVSMLMPMQRSGREVQQNHLRFKNLLNEADEQLQAAGLDRKVLDPLRQLPEKDAFWQHQGEGLAVYAHDGEVQMFRLRRPLKQQVAVGETCLLAPLASDRSAHQSYFVLALTWEDAKLFRGSDAGLELVETDDLPAKFDELVQPAEPEAQLQYNSFQSSGIAGSGTNTAMYHGQGSGENSIEGERRNYLSRVGKLVAKELYGSKRPLVVMATNEVIGHFAAATDLTIAAKVDGSPAELNDEQLGKHAQEAISGQLAGEATKLTERLGTALAQSQGSMDITEVLAAAAQGRVDTLIVADGPDILGTFDRERMQTRRDDAGNIELTNAAVVETLRTRGSVVAAPGDDFPPENSRVAAIYRY